MKNLICALSRFFFRGKSEYPSHPKRILVIRSGALGDVLMSTPFLRALRARYPEAEINYLVGRWSEEALNNNPHVDKIISFDDDIIFRKRLLKVLKLVYSLRRRKYDLCFILDKSYLFSLFASLSGAGYRVGFDRYGEGFANHANVVFEGMKYEAEYYLDLIGSKGTQMELFPTKKDVDAVNTVVGPGSYIGLAPGGAENPGQTMHLKRWPKEKYVELIKKLLKKKVNIILFGGESDIRINASIIDAVGDSRVRNLAGVFSVQQSCVLMKKCKLVVSHDSGAMHIAGAAGVPLIALFGPTPATRFAPPNATVVAAASEECPCYDVFGTFNCKVDCMSLIEVDAVLEQVNKKIYKASTKHS